LAFCINRIISIKIIPIEKEKNESSSYYAVQRKYQLHWNERFI